MDYARLLVSRLVQDQSVAPVLDAGLEPAMVPDPEPAAVLAFLLDFHAQHHTVPSAVLLKNAFPSFPLSYAADPAGFYIEQLLDGHVRNEILGQMATIIPRLARGEPSRTLAREVQRLAGRVASLGSGSRELDVCSNVEDRREKYARREATVGLLGIPTPWPTLDEMTQGWQPEWYVGFAGRPKAGKSWTMLRVAMAAWQAGCKVLFVNQELSDDLMFQRFDSLHFRLPYGRFRSGMLTDTEKKRYNDGLTALEASKGVLPLWLWVHAATTVSAIAAKIEKHQPDLVLVDGAYLLRDEEGGKQEWERNKNISRGLKRVAQTLKVPLIISIQLNRGGDAKKRTTRDGMAPLSLSDVAHSDAYAQDVDLLLGLEQTADMRLARELEIVPLAERESAGGPFRVGWDFETMESPDLGPAVQRQAAQDAATQAVFDA